MHKSHHRVTPSPCHLVIAALTAAISLATPARAETLSIIIPPPRSPGPEHFMGKGPGSATAPDAATSKIFGTIGYDNDSLLKNGHPFIPVMGEFHYSRYPRSEWRDELLKMKAGGVTIISTYVFWIHHEEIQGQFDWTGDKDLHAFVELCGELGLPILIRIGPWCHGEVRNGGHPDWVEALPKKRRLDPQYMAAVTPLYAQIAAQLKGLLWKDGGPIIGIQLENEYGGDPAYLLTLKNLARADGLDVPLYTKTGWPAMKTPVPFGELLPYFGSYAEGFWDRNLDSMPQDKYWQAFTFTADRIDTAIGSDIFGTPPAGTHADESDAVTYPYLTCEDGTGMIPSYHRRILMNTMDTYAVALCKIGSGVNLPGYYLYHGGTNPDSKTGIHLSESQATGMWNDMPNKTYDWDGPLGEFGQVRESYHYLRRLHLFLADFGESLARMPAIFPGTIKEKTDNKSVRWSVRSDGKSGFLFVNNYQRALDEPAKEGVQFEIKLAKETIKIPETGTVTLPANNAFFWPINMDVGGSNLIYATAQPICHLEQNGTTYVFFAQTPGIPAEFAFGPEVTLDSRQGNPPRPGDRQIVSDVKAGEQAPIQLHNAAGKKTVIFIYDEARSLRVWKTSIAGKNYVLQTDFPNLFIDGNLIHLDYAGNMPEFRQGEFSDNGPEHIPLATIPPFSALSVLQGVAPDTTGSKDVAAYRIAIRPMPIMISIKGQGEQTQPPGQLRQIKMGSQKVAEQPTDADFAGPEPAIYTIKLPDTPKNTKVLLRLHYTGDVARLYLGDKLLEDNFYNTNPMDFGLWRLPANTTELTLKILPLQKNAPIMLPQWPDFKGKDSVAELQSVELIPEQTVTLEAK